jgi:hypothetical protein
MSDRKGIYRSYRRIAPAEHGIAEMMGDLYIQL